MVKVTEPTTLAFVFSEHWPSGAFVAKSLGGKEVHTYVQRASLGLEEYGLGETLSSIETMSQQIIDSLPHRAKCWIYGSENFVDFILLLIKDQVHLDVYFVISDSGGRTKLNNEFLQSNFTWAFLTHKEVGGILQGCWKIGAKV